MTVTHSTEITNDSITSLLWITNVVNNISIGDVCGDVVP